MITEEFKKTFTSVVAGYEGNKLKIYDDGFGVPTIGIGFALINKISDRWKAYDQKELQEKGINLTTEQHKIIQDYAKVKTNGDDISDLRSQLNDIDVTITPETARKLLQYSIQDKYKTITSTIGEDKWDKLNLAQQVGVMDHVFQRGNVLSLKESLIAGDYATTAKIMREVPKDNKALKHRADIRADFVEYGKMEFDGIHIVQAGDTASRIAKSSGISLKELSDFEKKGFDLMNPLDEVRIHEAYYKRVLKMVLEHMEQMVQKSQENLEQENERDESNPNMIKDLRNKVLDNIRTKFKELVEDTKVKSKKDNEEDAERVTQLETDAKNKKIDIIVHEYHKKIHEFIDKTSRCIVQASDNDGNIENTIGQQVSTFLQGVALDLSTAVDLSIIDLTI